MVLLQLYLKAMLEAIYEESVNVTAYTAWSFLDNFEWLEGLTLVPTYSRFQATVYK